MGFERWTHDASQREIPYRLPICGHVQLRETSFRKDETCGVCGADLPDKMTLAFRDFVPASDLTWPWASVRESHPIEPLYKAVV